MVTKIRFYAHYFAKVTNTQNSDDSGGNVLCQIFPPKILCATWLRFFKLKPNYKKKKE